VCVMCVCVYIYISIYMYVYMSVCICSMQACMWVYSMHVYVCVGWLCEQLRQDDQGAHVHVAVLRESRYSECLCMCTCIGVCM
jgi:hypothetical protein